MRLLSLLAFAFLFCTQSLYAFQTTDWSLAKDKDGVQVYTRKIDGSSLKEFKAVTILKTDIEDVLALVNDIPGYVNWMHNCKESKVLEEKSETNVIMYNLTGVPVVSNRDNVIELNAVHNEDGSVQITFHALPNYIPKRRGIVRMPAINGMWEITPLEDGRVKVMQRVHADPGGSVPAWLSNSSVVDSPHSTFSNMKERLEK